MRGCKRLASRHGGLRVAGPAVHLALALLCAGSAAGRARPASGLQVALVAETNAREVRVGDVFQLDVQLTIEGDARVAAFELPDVSAFELLRSQKGPTSSRTTIINGRMSVQQSSSHTMLLRARAPGELRIGPARAEVAGQTFTSEPILVRVLERGQADEASPSSALDPGARFPAGAELPSYFVDVRFDRDELFVGEQAVLSVQLYTREQSEIEVNDLDAPKPSGFWVEVLQTPTRVRPTQRSVRGQTYLVYPLMKVAMFPLEPGAHTLDAIPLGITVSSGGIWGRRKAMTLMSEPALLVALPLPEEGRPSDFDDGNVGRYTLRAHTDKREVPLGQPVTLRVTVRGEGNIGGLRLPSLPAALPGARVFPPSVEESQKIEGERVGGEKRLEILVQPTAAGRFEVPALEWSYFDPGLARYIRERTDAIPIRVVPSSVTSRAGPGKTELARGARPLMRRLTPDTRPPWPRRPEPFVGLAGLWGLALGVAAVGVRRRRFAASRHGQAAAARRDRAARLARALGDQDLPGVERVLLDALAEACGAHVRGLATDALAPALRHAGIEQNLVERAVAFLRATLAARYAPQSDADLRKLLAEARQLLPLLEEHP